MIIPPPPPSVVIPPPPPSASIFESAPSILTKSMFHDYQKATVAHLLTHPDAMLWLGLGLGKTVTSLTAFSDLRALGEVKKLLVIAPLRVCELQWEQECAKWDHLQGKLKFSKMIGTAKKRQNALFSEADVYMVNYESLGWLVLQLQHYFIKQDLPVPFDVICFDEVSKMKRPESNRFKEFMVMVPHFKRRWGLTASPASNGLTNLWGQFFCIDNGERLGSDYKQFVDRFFHKTDGQYGKYVAYDTSNGMSSKEMLIKRIQDITLEIPAEGNLDMPPFNVMDIVVTLPPKKYAQYKKLEDEFFVELDNGAVVEPFNSAALASKLLQFSDGIVYNYPDETRPDYRTEEFVHDVKYKALDDIITESGDEPIFLAYNFSSEREEILRRYPNARCMTGASEAEAVEMQSLFNAGEIKLLIAHPLSAGHGLNLQRSCSIVIWFGLNYNLELYEQFIGRIYRQGQSNPVRCYRILTRDTIDMAVSIALSDKDIIQKDIKARMREAGESIMLIDDDAAENSDEFASVIESYKRLTK